MLCDICATEIGTRTASYKCPKCAINYCSLRCYRDKKHEQCTEMFYKSCVDEAINDQRESNRPVMYRELNEQLTNIDDREPETEEDKDYIDIIAADTISQVNTMADGDIDRALTLIGATSTDDEDALTAMLTADERRAFAQLAEQFEQQQQALGASVFSKKKL